MESVCWNKQLTSWPKEEEEEGPRPPPIPSGAHPQNLQDPLKLYLLRVPPLPNGAFLGIRLLTHGPVGLNPFNIQMEAGYAAVKDNRLLT